MKTKQPSKIEKDHPPISKDLTINKERIAKYMARVGIGSRRDIENWIKQGRVCLNGAVLTSPAVKVNGQDTILFDGKPIEKPQASRLFLYHKPRGLVVSHKDEKGRASIFDDLPDDLPRLIAVGRLDLDSEGLILLTNDGELARFLELPQYGQLRLYRVRAFGKIPFNMQHELAAGVKIDGIHYRQIDMRILDKGNAPSSSSPSTQKHKNHWLEIGLKEGKNREIRKLLAHYGLQVNRLIRIGYGDYRLGALPVGTCKEIKNLQRSYANLPQP